MGRRWGASDPEADQKAGATGRQGHGRSGRDRLHHYRNENYWLGVSSNTGDRLLRTLPKHKTDVPLSETARTLA